MQNRKTLLLADYAWIDGAWSGEVLLEIDATGGWSRIDATATTTERSAAKRMHGALLPGVVNAHSHAFQRAIAGLTEQHADVHAADDFWSWRDRMYSAANQITPAQLETIAIQLYRELLAGGYTQVCEFHYLHQDPQGHSYADPAEMALALVRAAQQSGIGLTILPTLYMCSGFNATGLRHEQRRFASTPDSIMRMIESIERQSTNIANVNCGVALHSLRAVSGEAIATLAAYADQRALPIHIHVAEQTAEVDECIAHTGQRPVEWLLDNADLGSRWNLVHATHASASELRGVAERGAAIVLCPTTEANLGDGVFPLPDYAALDGVWSVGSDSHITRAWPEELRMLEYSQRLMRRQRNIAASALQMQSSAGAMFEAQCDGAGNATGLRLGRIEVGHRADFTVLDPTAASLQGIPLDHLLDAAVFSGPARPLASTHVGGLPVAALVEESSDSAFANAMRGLWRHETR